MKQDSLALFPVFTELNFYNRKTLGGRHAIYIRNIYQATKITNLSVRLPYNETLFSDVTQPLSYIVGMLYRPRNSDAKMFLSSLTDIITSISVLRKPVYLMGHFNINILNHAGNNANILVNLFHRHSFFPAINKPTRVTTHSATVINHLWTNNFDNYITSVKFNTLSDHFPIVSSLFVGNNKHAHKIVTIIKRTLLNLIYHSITGIILLLILMAITYLKHI